MFSRFLQRLQEYPYIVSRLEVTQTYNITGSCAATRRVNDLKWSWMAKWSSEELGFSRGTSASLVYLTNSLEIITFSTWKYSTILYETIPDTQQMIDHIFDISFWTKYDLFWPNW